MRAIRHYSYTVPCKSTQERHTDALVSIDPGYCLNPDITIRRQPEGSLIIPDDFDSHMVFIDVELTHSLLRSETFPIRHVSSAIFKTLIDNKILIKRTRAVVGTYHIVDVLYGTLPVRAILEVTSRCQCKCNTCYRGEDINNHTPQLSDVLSRIGKLAELGVCQLEVSGGEPLMRHDLLQILSYARSRGLKYFIVTNGEYLAEMDDGLMEEIRCAQAVAIHIDGIGAVHDFICGRLGLFEQVVKGIEKLKAAHVKIYFVSTVQESNLAQVEPIVAFAKQSGAIVQFRPVIKAGYGANVDGRRDARTITMPHIEGSIAFSGSPAPGQPAEESHFYGCPAGVQRITVDQFGIVRLCTMERNSPLGPVIDLSQEKLYSVIVEATRARLGGRKACRECTYARTLRCGGFCMFSRRFGKEFNQETEGPG